MANRLTRREIQCVRLAGESLSNKEIAARLRVSPRTVNNHLSAAYAKLATSNRQDAAAVVAREYPDFTRLQPIPIASPAPLTEVSTRPGDELAATPQAASENWLLPAPPETRVLRLAIILGLTVLAAVITMGLVAIVDASLASIGGYAPTNAAKAPVNR